MAFEEKETKCEDAKPETVDIMPGFFSLVVFFFGFFFFFCVNHLFIYIFRIQTYEGYQVGESCNGTVLGGHYDPFNASVDITTEMYNIICTTESPEGCELGDLAGKFGTLAING